MTNGLIPFEGNVNLISEEELKEFDFYRQEYNDMMSEKIENLESTINIPEAVYSICQ